MPIDVRCECGQRLRAKDSQAGTHHSCPKCGRDLLIPLPHAVHTPAAVSTQLADQSAERRAPDHIQTEAVGSPISSGLTGVGLFIAVTWGVLALLWVISWIIPALAFVANVLLIAGSMLLGLIAVRLVLAKVRVLKTGDVPLMAGMLRLIAWEPTQGVVILKNKAVKFVDDNLADAGGGIRLIYPILGEELALRVPLELQSIEFEDAEVLTREYLPLDVKGTIKWRIIGLDRFYLLVSKELRRANEGGESTVCAFDEGAAGSYDAQRKLGAAEEWLRLMAEEQTRTIVSRINTGLLIAEQIAEDLPAEVKERVAGHVVGSSPFVPQPGGKYRAATDGLAATIYASISERVKQYGIQIHEVTLQEVRLPAAIHQQCVEACSASYVPFIAQKEAAASKMKLQAEADVIGTDAAAAREVASVAPAYALSDFLTQYISRTPGLARRALPQASAIEPQK